MGWTERKEILTSYESIMDYEVDLTIEEVIPSAKIQGSIGLVWDFHFKGVTSFEISVDVAAEHIEFGIPSQEE